ncbi:MAG: DNA-3-methyladenine glycosylase [Mycobacteriaceae bacterium]
MDGAADRARLSGTPEDAARALLGATLRARGVSARIVEVEAYAGLADPASHAFRGMTDRTAVMFGPAGYLYAYFVYGMHTCLNVSTGPDGVGSAVLLRAAEVVSGADVAAARRPAARRPADLARGPANLALALGITLADGGTNLLAGGELGLELREPATDIAVGPRVGVSAAAEVAWRFWLPGHPAVSAYRRSPRAGTASG